MNINNGLDKLRGLMIDNLPHILTGVGVTGLAVTACEAYKAGKKVDQMEDKDPKKVAKALLPTVIAGVVSATATISSDVVHTKKYATLMTSYLIAKAEAPKLKKAAEEVIGKEKLDEIKKKAKGEDANESEKKRAAELSQVSPKRRFRVVDAVTGFEFESTIEKLYKAEQMVARIVNREGRASLEDFYGVADDSDEPFDAPAIAACVYWDTDSRFDEMNMTISKEVDDCMNVYLVIGYEFNTDSKSVRYVP